MRAERRAHAMQRRNKPRNTQITILRPFCQKLCTISLPCQIFRRLNAPLIALCVHIVVHTLSSVETRTDTRKFAITRRYCPKLSVTSLPFELFRRSNAPFTALCLQNVVHTLPSAETRPDIRKSRSFVDFD